MSEHVGGLSNADVSWEGTYVGFTPVIDPGKRGRIRDLGEEGRILELIAALTAENAFVAAHVILTQLSGIAYRAFPDWNGLRIDIDADGTVKIDPDQRFELAQRWRRWYHADPRPQELPSDA